MKISLWKLLLILFISYSCQSENSEGKKTLVQNSLLEQNVIFQASGTEPNWQIQINVNRRIKIESDTKYSNLTTPDSKVNPIMDVAATSYHAETKSTEIRLEIFKQECIDKTSGDTLSYMTNLYIKFKNEDEFTKFGGCGKYLPDYRLNDIWVLEKLNGKEIDQTSFKNKRPYLEINLKDLKVMGFAGCNNFSGSIAFEGPDLIFSENLAMTRMACPNLDFESEFVQALTRSSLMQEISDNKLILKRGEIELIFKKVD